jgi:predicted alpha/beta hydrolase family esterase
MNNYIIVHGSYGSPDGNWFPWLAKYLENFVKVTKAEKTLYQTVVI